MALKSLGVSELCRDRPETFLAGLTTLWMLLEHILEGRVAHPSPVVDCVGSASLDAATPGSWVSHLLCPRRFHQERLFRAPRACSRS